MKILSFTFKNFLQYRYRKKQPLINPDFAWSAVLSISAILFLILLLWSYHVFNSIKKAGFTEDSIAKDKSFDVLDSGVIKDILKFYDKKAEQLKTLKEKPVHFVDPSL